MGLKMKLRVISDIHNEFRADPVQIPVLEKEKEQILIIAGDYSPLSKIKNYKKEFDNYTERFKAVLFVLGNHEYYGFKIDNFRVQKIFSELNLKSNFHLLTRYTPSIKIENTRFVGAMLWTDLGRSDYISYLVKEQMNDFKKITWVHNKYGCVSYSKFNTKNWLEEFVKDLDYIKSEIANHKEDEIIVITHYGPSLSSSDTRYSENKEIHHAYVSDLDGYIKTLKNVPVWIHGHIHEKKDYKIGDTRVVVNPFAYPGEFGSDEEKENVLKFLIESKIDF